MKAVDIDLDTFELHEMYLRGVFNMEISSIAESANRKLKGKFKTQKKVDQFILEIEKHLSPLNKSIPATGQGIARFYERQAPGLSARV